MTMALPKVSKKGFDLGPGRGSVLLFHGYTGTPYDLRLVAEFLHRHDYRVIAPLLKGHGKKPAYILGVQTGDWLKNAEEALNKFDKKRPLIVGGLSMGALLATLLAAKNHNIAALLLFSPAFCLGCSFSLIKLSAQLGIFSEKSTIHKISGGCDVMDSEAKEKSPGYKEMPVAGLLQFDELRKQASDTLIDVRCPIFMAFGRYDEAIDAKSSHKFALANIRQPIFSKFYDHSKHVITLDYDKEELCKDLIQFLQRCEK